MDCLQRLADLGVQILNSPKSLETCIDKWLTLHRLELADLPIPPTIACQTREQAMAAFEALEKDVVVKPLFWWRRPRHDAYPRCRHGLAGL